MREYTIPMTNVTVTSTNTLVAFSPAANSSACEVLRAWASQSANATSAQQHIRLVTQFNVAAANQVVGAVGTLGKTKMFDPASQLTATTVCGPGGSTVNCTSDGNGVKTTLYPDNFNVLNGWLWVPTPVETHMLGNATSSQSYGLFFPVTPGTLTSWSAGLSIREVG